MSEPSIINAVAQSGLFGGLPAEFVDFLATHARSRQLAKDHVLFHYGQKADHFYLGALNQLQRVLCDHLVAVPA